MYKIFGNADGTFGYDLYYGTRRIIHQSQIPAVSGNTGFQQKKHAVWVAELAIKKLEQGESLPTISLDELKKLKVI